MPHIVTTKSLVISTPVVDEKGKPVTEESKFNGRKVVHQIHDHVQHPAGAVVFVEDKKFAKELIDNGHAREHVAGIDDDEAVDPTKSADPLA